MSPGEPASLVSAWQPRIRAYFLRRCRDRDDVDDLVQESSAAILQSWASFAHRSSVSTWVYAVCRNVFSNHLYYRERDARLVRRMSVESPAEDSPLPAALRDAIALLPPESRALYVLHYVQGRGMKEIAARLGRPEGTVKYLLHVLRGQVKRLLES